MAAEKDRDNETKRRIIKMAFKMFKRDGFDRVTINEICTQSSISKHTFYYYFRTKDDILTAFHMIPKEIRAERIHNIITAENYFEQYWLLVEPIAMFFNDNGPEITKSYFIAKTRRDPHALKKPIDKEKDALEITIIKKAQENGEIRNKSDPHELHYLSFKLIISSAYFWGVGGGERDLMNDTRGSLEVCFDVPPEIRKAQYKRTT